MKKAIIIILIATTLFWVKTQCIYAKELSDQSASIKERVIATGFDYRVENLRKFLEKYNSPLAPFASDFVRNADSNGLDYRLVPSISEVESTFAKNIPFDSYNAYGWVNGDYRFKSWPDSISKVSETLKTGYIDKGATSIPKIAKIYAPPSTTWGTNVKYFVEKIDTIPLNFDII